MSRFFERKLELKVNHDKWGSLSVTKQPSKVNELITISEWDDTNPKEHLWVRLRDFRRNDQIFDSSTLIALAEILKKILKEPNILREKEKK
jgi:hypothetical protein